MDLDFDAPDDERLRLDRAYLKVDRIKLKAMLSRKHADANVQLVEGFVAAEAVAPNLFDGGLVHDKSGSTLTISLREHEDAMPDVIGH